MKCVRIHEHGGVDKLCYEDIPEPTPAPDEVLVHVNAVSINHLDIWIRKGLRSRAIALPRILGSDAAGVVEAVGSTVKNGEVGNRVAVAPGEGCGICEQCLAGKDNFCRRYIIRGENADGVDAEYIAVPARSIIPISERLSFEDAAAVPLVFLTAWQMLVDRARVQPDEDVLIMAAGSGVGSAGVQIAKLFGARVIATASTDEKLLKAKELGADEGINHSTANVLEETQRLTNKKGVDIVFDHIGKDTWQQSIRCLARGGRLVTCGATTGAEAMTDLRYVYFKQLSILGSTMGSRASLFRIFRYVEEGKLKPVIDTILPMSAVAEGHRRVEERKHFGKIILKP
jgi:NADPH:quinone reductase-like Zn-dependent oxidoreductase